MRNRGWRHGRLTGRQPAPGGPSCIVQRPRGTLARCHALGPLLHRSGHCGAPGPSVRRLPASRPGDLDAFMEKSARAARGQPQDAQSVCARRNRDIRGARARPLAAPSHETRLHLVRAGTGCTCGVPSDSTASPSARTRARIRAQLDQRGSRNGRNAGRRKSRRGRDRHRHRGVQVSGAASPTEPRFVSEAYFMDFKFEPGNYYLAGRETARRARTSSASSTTRPISSTTTTTRRRREARDRKKPAKDRTTKEQEQDIERKMNKTALVTLWVDPAEHQIVKYTFDNVWMDFLPGAWLVRVDDIRASMTMGQPFPGVWLPRTMNIHAGLTLAAGLVRGRLRPQLHELPRGRGQDHDQGAKDGSQNRDSGLGARDPGLATRGSGLGPGPAFTGWHVSRSRSRSVRR